MAADPHPCWPDCGLVRSGEPLWGLGKACYSGAGKGKASSVSTGNHDTGQLRGVHLRSLEPGALGPGLSFLEGYG